MKLLDRDNIQLAIFDLDGTLIHSTGIWSDIDEAFFEKRGMKIPPNYSLEIAHLGLEEAAKFTQARYLPNENYLDIIKEWKDMAKKAYEEDIDICSWGKELIEALISRDVHIALATANSKELYEPCLKRLGIYHYFDYIADVNQVNEGKNSPKIYDDITKHFNLKKENVVVFEDILEAMSTAFNAGYLTIGVYDYYSTEGHLKEIKQNCHYFAQDLIKVWIMVTEENELPIINIDNFKVKKFIDGYEIMGLVNDDIEVLNIPAYINDKRVYRVGREVFKDNTFKEIILNEGLLYVDVEAFMGTKNAKEIIIPSSVLELSTYAFIESSFERIEFKGYVEDCFSPFGGCPNLKEIIFPPTFKRISMRCFWLCPSIEEVHFPEGMEVIGDQAFNKCEALTTIHLSKTIKVIESYAFYRCYKLKTVYYHGSRKDREKLDIRTYDNGNDILLNADWIYDEE